MKVLVGMIVKSSQTFVGSSSNYSTEPGYNARIVCRPHTAPRSPTTSRGRRPSTRRWPRGRGPGRGSSAPGCFPAATRSRTPRPGTGGTTGTATPGQTPGWRPGTRPSPPASTQTPGRGSSSTPTAASSSPTPSPCCPRR